MTRLAHWLAPWKPGGASWKHYRLGFVILLIAAVLFQVAVTVTTVKVVQHYQGSESGYKPGPLPPITKALGGPALPASDSLLPDLARIHNQQASWSCVGQTVSTMTEIVECERWHREHHRGHCPYFSAGYIWNAFNGGGYYTAISYSDAFPRLINFGEARLRDFWPDGYNGWTIYPPNLTAALPYRASTWRQISASDSFTIRQEIHAGRPIAIAFNWQWSLVNSYGVTGTVYQQYGGIAFGHSTTIVGYNPTGVVIENSFGPRWGNNGHLTLAWSFVASVNAALIIADPSRAIPAITKPAPFNVQLWQSVTTLKRRANQPYRHKGKLTHLAWSWKNDRGVMKRAGAPTHRETWLRRLHVEKVPFQHATAYHWPTRRGDPVRWVFR